MAWHGRYHTHDPGDYEIHLFLEGDGVFLLNRSKHAIEGNHLFLVRPREFHSILPDAVRRPISYYAILIEPDPELAADRELLSLINDRNIGESLSDRRCLALESRERFFMEELYRLAGDKSHSRAREYLLLSLLHRWYGDAGPQKTEFLENYTGRNENIERSLRIMEKSVREKLSIDVLAGKLGLSEEHFIRLFHRKLGMSPFQYFTRLKIEGASSFLVDTNLKIYEVADHFGFENPFHFSRIFKKCTGLSPLEYRRIFARPFF